jgi:hypothetical protein
MTRRRGTGAGRFASYLRRRNRNKAAQKTADEQLVEEWNARHAPGTRVTIRDEVYAGFDELRQEEKKEVRIVHAFTVGKAFLTKGGTAATLINTDRGTGVAALAVITVKE